MLFISEVASQTYYDNKQGTQDGYDFELWKDTGTTQMTLMGNGAFSCSWSNINNCLFRTGKKLGSTKTYDQYGTISINYEADYNPNGNSYLCVYGWMENPTVEYYIVESWGSWRPPGNYPLKGTITVDGATWDFYQSTRVQQPSIHGTETFEQYWSVRQVKKGTGKIAGTISVSEHFKNWEAKGYKLGKMYEVALNIEGYQSSGKATISKNALTIGGSSSGSSGSSSQPSQPSYPSGGSSGTFFLKNPNSGKYLVPNGNSIVISSSPKAWSINNGAISINGKCIDSYSDQIQMYDCWGGENQQWEFKSDGTIVLKGTNKAITIGNNGTAEGNYVGTYDAYGAPGQIFQKC